MTAVLAVEDIPSCGVPGFCVLSIGYNMYKIKVNFFPLQQVNNNY
jgi:hypothetical protein